MEYMLFSTDGSVFPYKLSNKLNMEEVQKMGFEKTGVLDLEKQNDGSYLPKPRDEHQQKLKEQVEEKMRMAEESNRKIQKEILHSPKNVTMMKKTHLTKEDIELQQRVVRVSQCLRTGEEIDDEIYYVSTIPPSLGST